MTGQSKDNGAATSSAVPVPLPLPTPSTSKKDLASLRAVYISTFVNALSTMTVVQATPVLMARACGGDMAKTFVTLGRLASLSAALEIVLNPVLGRWSDKVGRKVILLVSMLTSAAIRFLLSKFPGNFNIISLSRSLGATMLMVNLTIARIVVADVAEGIDGEKKKEHFQKSGAILGASFGFSAIIGMIIGGKLTAKDPTSPFRVSVFLGLLAAVIAALRVGDTRPASLKDSSATKKGQVSPFNFVKFFQRSKPDDPVQRSALVELHAANALQNFITNMGFDVPQAFCRARFAWEATQITRWLALSASVSTLSNLVSRPLMKTLQEPTFTVLTTLAAAFVAIKQGTASVGRDMFVALGPNVLAGSMNTSLMASLNQLESNERSSDFQANMSNLQAFLRVIAPLVYGQIFAWGVKRGMPGAPYLLNALLATLALILYNRATRKLKRNQTPK